MITVQDATDPTYLVHCQIEGGGSERGWHVGIMREDDRFLVNRLYQQKMAAAGYPHELIDFVREQAVAAARQAWEQLGRPTGPAPGAGEPRGGAGSLGQPL